jgi:hypothetical protein
MTHGAPVVACFRVLHVAGLSRHSTLIGSRTVGVRGLHAAAVLHSPWSVKHLDRQRAGVGSRSPELTRRDAAGRRPRRDGLFSEHPGEVRVARLVRA